jgi:hypothetical protein
MFEAQQKSTGTSYTMTVALLLVALVFSPTVVVYTWPLGYLGVSLALACSVVCIGLAWLNWKRFAQLSILTIES